MKCSYCKGVVSGKEKTCPNCGAPLETEPDIHQEAIPETEYDYGIKPLNLGVSGSGIDEHQRGAKYRGVYVLLGLFLGLLGVHNFYAGYNGRGIAQLLITLLGSWLILPEIAVAIWVIVEICIIKRDAQGVEFE